MKKHSPLFLILICLLLSCGKGQPNLTGLWFFTYGDMTKQTGTDAITPESFIYFEKGGAYTSNIGGFESGKWEWKKDQLTLTGGKDKTTIYSVQDAAAKTLVLGLENGLKIELEKQKADFTSPAVNPFSADNNQWRMKAAKKETAEEIKSRVINHFRFHELYFKWGLESGLNSLDVRSTPSLIKIYGNGFELTTYENLPQGWKDLFFDEEDCHKATDIVKYVFDKYDIAWSKTDNKFKMFISAFQQLQQQLKKPETP